MARTPAQTGATPKKAGGMAFSVGRGDGLMQASFVFALLQLPLPRYG